MNQTVQTKPLSKQQQKSMETKARIFAAAKNILQKDGYEALSIKNICDEAGVSNGSFYHHFKTKDDLLSYYIEEQPSINPDFLDLPASPAEAKEPVSEPAHPYGASLSDRYGPQLSAEMHGCRNFTDIRRSGSSYNRYPYDRDR